MVRELQDTLDAFTSLGLSLGEAKTYVALSSQGVSEASPLAVNADVPQPKIYSYLTSLEEKGLVRKIEIKGSPNRYSAVAHSYAIEKLQSELDEKIRTAKDYISNQQDSTNSSKINEIIYITQGDKLVREALKNIAQKLKSNAYILAHSFYTNIIEEDFLSRQEIEYIFPLDSLRTHPIFQVAMNFGFDEITEQNRAMFMFQDVDLNTRTCKAVNIIAFPTLENFEPLLIELHHPTIINFQLNIVLAVLDVTRQHSNHSESKDNLK